MKKGSLVRGRDRRRQRKRRRLRAAILSVCAIVFVYCAARVSIYAIRSVKNRRMNEEIGLLYEMSAPTAIPSTTPAPTATSAPDATKPPFQYIGEEVSRYASALYEKNSDLVGWLNIPNVLALPVVYRDNEYYLTHDFYGRQNDAGTIFLDENHPLAEDTQFLFIHGHAMYDGSMFGEVTHYRKLDYIRSHPYLTFNTLYSNDSYEILGSLYVEEDEMVSIAGLAHPVFDSPEEFNEFIDTFRKRAIHFTKDDVPPDTALLALSTCHKDGRIVVLFKRVSSQPLE